MNELERISLTTAFLAAVVVAGISLSLVVHVELVTLVVFASGVLLGSRQGAVIGAAGMLLYVLSNTALRGFPPSPLPVLALQCLGMSLPGAAGGFWRRWWLTRGRTRRTALLALPFLGFILTAVNQALLNFGYAWILADDEAPRGAMFLSGMAFGLLDMVWNAVVFALAGPQVASVLRRMARQRGWWTPALLTLLLTPALSAAQTAAIATDSTTVAASADSTITSTSVDSTASGSGMALEPRAPREPLRPLRTHPEPLWLPVSVAEAGVRGVPSLSGQHFLVAEEPAWMTTTGLPHTVDRWALGWGRTRYSYDGLPLNGPVHGFSEPPDLPLAWQGVWRERWTASGTAMDVAAPPSPGEASQSQISVTTGSFNRRTAEFALFRELGPVELGVDFQDREELGFLVVDDLESSRLWVHVSSRPGRRPDWSLDASTAVETQGLFSGAEMGREARRLQGTMRGPFLGGETRIAGQWRRQILRLDGGATPFGEIVFDGFTGVAEWAPPVVPDLAVQLVWDFDRRRGGLPDEATHTGGRGGLVWHRQGEGWKAGAEGWLGHQAPFGWTQGGAVVVEAGVLGVGLRAGLSHDEELPPMVLGVDRVAPENGIAQHLEGYETAGEPERRTALRVEGRVRSGRAALTAGGWAARVRRYRIESNPLWVLFSDFVPTPFPDDEADIFGAYADMEVDLGRGFSASGEVRVHDRPAGEVPYLSRWLGRGSVHLVRTWFSESLELDAAVGGVLLGERQNPLGELYPITGVGFFSLIGRIDNGVVSFTLNNITDTFVEADIRSADTVTPLPMTGRTFVLGLTFYLTD